MSTVLSVQIRPILREKRFGNKYYEADVSTTSTISNGLLTVFTVFDVDDNADNPTKKSESPFLTQRMEAKLLLKVKKFCFGGNLRTGN